MDWLTKIWNSIKTTLGVSSSSSSSTPSVKGSKPIFNGKKTTPRQGEIRMSSDLSDEQIQANQVRAKYIQQVKNPPYKVQSGDTIGKIAQRFGVDEATLIVQNGLNSNTAKNISLGQVLKIPNRKIVKNVHSINDVAKSMGVSVDFVKKLKRMEDSAHLPDNKFHNTPYRDGAGVETIGIGHVLKRGEPRKLSNSQVCELCAKDLLKVEESISAMLGGQKVYDRLPQAMKEALLDMAFNKGPAILEKTPGLLYTLKVGKYEAAINKMTYNKSTTTGKEMSGLSKRRLFDISTAMKIYHGKVPQSNINTAQNVYNRGIELLRAECKAKGKDFNAQLAGYNKDVQSYFGNKVKIKLITK